MIDIHSHILFGVDDGAKTIDESIDIIKEEISKGVTHIVLTPHCNNKYVKVNKEKVLQNFNALRERISKENLNINVYMGNEVYFDDNYFEVLEQGSFYTLANSRYILIEFDIFHTPKNIAEICYETKIKGYIPIIAHVERYEPLYKNTENIKEILNEGALLQVNASSLANKDNKEKNKFIKYLLKEGLVSFVASDIHNLDRRSFYLDEAFKTVKKTYGETYALKIFRNNQLKVINNEHIQIPHIKTNEGRIWSEFFLKKFI